MSTLTLRPDSDSVVACSRSGGATNYGCVDETPASDADYIYVTGVIDAAGTTSLDLYGMPDRTTETGVISSVTLYMRGWKSSFGGYSGTGGTRLAVKMGGTTYYSSSQTLAITASVKSNAWTGNPNNSNLPWTWANIDALIAGVEISSSWYYDGDLEKHTGYTYCSQFYVEVAYTVGARSYSFIFG